MDLGGLSPMNGETVVGICEDMCPEEERIRRIQEADAHKLELLPDASNAKWYRGTMIKKLQKSSADHSLQIPEHLRTPETLLKTIAYIEDVLMDKSGDPYFTHGETSSKLVVYLFIWDRYRMIAKDFTLQSTGLQVTDLWFECHERMARWMIYMDHFMRTEDEFTKCHAQQNGEQLNNLLKTLHGYYFKDLNNTHRILPNQCEFLGYFVIFQIGNGGEVTKYLQRLPIEILKSKELTFAIAVWTAIRTDNYAKFFQLLKICNPLQKSLLFRYLGEMRLRAIKKILKTNYVQSKNAVVKITLSLSFFQDLLLFDDIEEAKEFFEHCSVTILPSPTNPDDYLVSVEGQNIDALLPRDANDLPIRPKVPVVARLMEKALMKDAEGNLFTVQEICRGEFKKLSPSFPQGQSSSALTATTTPAAKVPKNLLNLKIPKKTPQAVQSPPPFDSPTPQTSSIAPFPPAVAAVPIPQKNALSSSQLQPAVPKEVKQVPSAALQNPFPFSSNAVAPQTTTALNNPFLKETVPVPTASTVKQLNAAAKPFVPGGAAVAAAVAPANVNPFTGAPIPPAAPVTARQTPISIANNPFVPGATTAANPFAKKDNLAAPSLPPQQQPIATTGANPFGFPPQPVPAQNAPLTGAKVIPPVPLFQSTPNEMITPVRRASKDFTAEELHSKISPQPPINVPLSRQRSADVQLQPPIPGLQRQKSSEKSVSAAIPSLVPETSVASSLSSLSTVTNGPKQLPLLSATSIDEFMSRQPPSLSITHPQDIPSLSRQTSIRTDGSTMSISPKPFGPTPGADNPLTMARTLSASRGPQHMGTPSHQQQQQQQPLKRQASTTSTVESPRLLKLEKEFHKKQSKRRVTSYFLSWKQLLIQRQSKLEKFYLRKSFRSWLKFYSQTKQTRNEFFSSIQSINIQPQQQQSSLANNPLLVIEAPSSSASSSIQLYQPPHARNNNRNNNMQSPSSFGFKKNQKRRPLREYSVLPAESVIGTDHERALSMIDADHHGDDGDDDNQEGANYYNTNERRESGGRGGQEKMGKDDSVNWRKGKSSSYHSEGGSLIAFSNDFPLTESSPFPSLSASASSSNHHLHMIPSFISSIMSILSLPCFLQQRKQFEHILIEPAITNSKVHQHQNIPHLEQFIADLPPSSSSLSSSSSDLAATLPFSLLNIYAQGLPGHFFPILKMKETFFQPSNPVLTTLTNFNSHLFCKMLLITPCHEKGLFVNEDDPVLTMFRSCLMNIPGFYSNFAMKDETKFAANQRKLKKLLKQKKNEEKKKQEDDENTVEEDDEDDEEDLSLRFTREERMKILKLFQNFQISSQESEFLLRNSEIFQLGLYENYHLSIHFQQQSSSSSSSSSADIFRNIRALPSPMHFSVAESSLTHCPSTDALQDQHLAVIFLSNYYPSSHLHENIRNYLERAPGTDFTLFLVIYLPENGDHREEEVIELPSFPTIHDLHAHYQSRHSHPHHQSSSATGSGKKKSLTSPILSPSKHLTSRELDEIQIIQDFLHLTSSHHQQQQHSAGQEFLSRIRRTLLVKKYSNTIYQQRILPRSYSSASSSSSSSSYTVSVPLLQFQLSDSNEMIHLQSLFQSFLDSQISSLLIQEIIPSINEKKKELIAPFVRSTNELILSNQSIIPSHISRFYRNWIIQKYYLKDFLSFHLFTSFFKNKNNSSSSSNNLLLKKKNDNEKSAVDDLRLLISKKGRIDQETQFFKNVFQSFLIILRDYQQFYYSFMQSLQTTISHSSTTTNHTLPEEFSYFQGKIDSYGIMKLSSSFQSDDSLAQYLPAWIPLEWKHPWYLEKCQVFVSNVIYPIEQFLLQSSSSSDDDMMVNETTTMTRETFFKKLTELDALSTFDPPENKKKKEKKQKNNNKSSSFVNDGLLTFQETFQALLLALETANEEDEEEGMDDGEEDSGLVLEISDIMKILHAILIQRFEILYPFLREHYRKQQLQDRQPSSFVYSDFDSLYYCHSLGETKANNPFLSFNFQQTHRLTEQRHSVEKLFDSLKPKEKSTKNKKDTPAKQTALTIRDASAEKDKKNKKRKTSSSAAEEDTSSKLLMPPQTSQKDPTSTGKGEKRRYASLYDTPTIGADWNPSLLQELENNSAIKNAASSLTLSAERTNNEDQTSSIMKKRKKENVLTIQLQKSPLSSSSSRINPPQPSPLAQYHQRQQQLQLVPMQQTTQQQQQELDEKILKEKFENQKKSSKKFLDFLQQQIMN